MLNKYKYIFAGFILILFALPSVIAFQLPAPNEERDCYKWGTTDGLYMCFVPVSGEYATWFSSYFVMHEYYTPQLKETAWGVGNQAVSQNKKVIQAGTLTVTGSPSYSYTKH